MSCHVGGAVRREISDLSGPGAPTSEDRPRPLLRLSFPDRAALEQEHAANLKHGRAFIKDAEGVAALDDVTVELALEAPCESLAIEAQAVLVCDSGPMRGIGVQLRPFNP